MRERLEIAATLTIIIAAILIAAAAVHREFFPAPEAEQASSARPEPSREYVEGWEDLLVDENGILIGDETATVKIIAFTDFQCPFCRQFHFAYRELKEELGSELALFVVHFPLRRHEFAIPAGRASECAHRQGRFAELMDVIFEQQESLGVKPWDLYAADAGTQDLTRFTDCMTDTIPPVRLDRGRQIGASLGVSSTPTVIINGWRVHPTPYESLPEVVQEIRVDGEAAAPAVRARTPGLSAGEEPQTPGRGAPIAVLELPPPGPPGPIPNGGFTRISSVRELQDGRVLVASRAEDRLSVVDWRTQEVTGVGRQGPGSSEYQTPYRLFPLAADSTLLVEDTRPMLWSILVGDRIVGKLRADRQFPQPLATEEVGGLDRDGRLLGLVGFAWDPELPGAQGHGPDSLLVLIAPRTSARADTLARLKGRGAQGYCISVGGSGGPLQRIGGCSPVHSEDRALLFQDGWVGIAYSEAYRVDWLTPEGEWIRGRPLPFSRVELDAAERCAAVRGWPLRGLEDPCEREEIAGRDWPEFLSPFLPSTPRGMSAPEVPGVLPAPDGSILIRRVPTAGNMASETRYDVVDRRGQLAGALILPANEAIVGLGARHVYVIETDEFDLQHLRRHPWPDG